MSRHWWRTVLTISTQRDAGAPTSLWVATAAHMHGDYPRPLGPNNQHGFSIVLKHHPTQCQRLNAQLTRGPPEWRPVRES